MRGRPKKNDSMMLNSARETKASEFASMILDQGMTIRQVADKVHMSKSSVHKYLKTYIDSASTKKKLDKALKNNFNEKHLRGGEATKKMYAEKRKENEEFKMRTMSDPKK